MSVSEDEGNLIDVTGEEIFDCVTGHWLVSYWDELLRPSMG